MSVSTPGRRETLSLILYNTLEEPGALRGEYILILPSG